MAMEGDERMDWKKIILTVLLIIIIAFIGYKGYEIYKEWRGWRAGQKENAELKILELLNDNQKAIININTEIASIKKRVVGETLKE